MTPALAERLIELHAEFQAALSQVRQERGLARGNEKTRLRKIGLNMDNARVWLEDALELVQ